MNLQTYLEQYESAHRHPVNQTCHRLGIPLIIMGILGLLTSFWPWAIGVFLAGAVALGVGHRVEGSRPAFYANPLFLLIGPLWMLIRLFQKTE